MMVKAWETTNLTPAERLEVWIGPSEEMATGNIINAHIIGLGETRELALADAQREAANVLALLSTGDVPELGSC